MRIVGLLAWNMRPNDYCNDDQTMGRVHRHVTVTDAIGS